MANSRNKENRRRVYLRKKQTIERTKRDFRFRRRREEDKNPQLLEERRRRKIPITIDQKRVWDINAASDIDGDCLGRAIDTHRLSKSETTGVLDTLAEDAAQDDPKQLEEELCQDDNDSMLDDESEPSDEASHDIIHPTPREQITERSQQARIPDASHPPPSDTSGSPPAALVAKFPSLFHACAEPRILVTTSIGGTIHEEARILTQLFPNSTYIRRTAHRYSYRFSLHEISAFACNRGYTALLVLREDQKRPQGLDIVHLPSGPTFHFSISNWVEGKSLPGHGNPTSHSPELVLNNFSTPLGVLTAIVKERRPTEKSVSDTQGNPVKGVEGIRVGLQELGPRFTLKLRRIDKGIQRGSGQEWEWKAGDEKQRTRFQL
ncbi:MAG: hypothetical protein Q9217_004247 [Psora testacea]